MRKSLKEKVLSNETSVDGKLLEKIADETAKEINTLSRNSKPKKIYLHGTNPTCLVKVMLALRNKLTYKTKIFTTKPPNLKYYSVNVGYYLPDHSEV